MVSALRPFANTDPQRQVCLYSKLAMTSVSHQGRLFLQEMLGRLAGLAYSHWVMEVIPPTVSMCT